MGHDNSLYFVCLDVATSDAETEERKQAAENIQKFSNSRGFDTKCVYFRLNPNNYRSWSDILNDLSEKVFSQFEKKIGFRQTKNPERVYSFEINGQRHLMAFVRDEGHQMEIYHIDEKGESKRPMVIHRSSIGCTERTMAYILEKTQGRLPTWLSPVQVKIMS
ncbi:MAG: hypothetical protein NT120_02425, partial [Candidatus Aenigmarchaeota archaeon]|nr:hypothetical protein [Candidatus Aenigmarchaeota archaeon]